MSTLHHSTTTLPTADTLTRLLTQQRFVRRLCECGRPGDIYADDDVTILCGRCWLAIYERDAGNER